MPGNVSWTVTDVASAVPRMPPVPMRMNVKPACTPQGRHKAEGQAHHKTNQVKRCHRRTLRLSPNKRRSKPSTGFASLLHKIPGDAPLAVFVKHRQDGLGGRRYVLEGRL